MMKRRHAAKAKAQKTSCKAAHQQRAEQNLAHSPTARSRPRTQRNCARGGPRKHGGSQETRIEKVRVGDALRLAHLLTLAAVAETTARLGPHTLPKGAQKLSLIATRATHRGRWRRRKGALIETACAHCLACLLYTSDAADE